MKKNFIKKFLTNTECEKITEILQDAQSRHFEALTEEEKKEFKKQIEKFVWSKYL
jgi:hypothetical protein